LCRTCGKDCTDLWPKVTCNEQTCIDKWEEQKKINRAKRYHTYSRNKRSIRFCEVCKKRIPKHIDGRSWICGEQTCIDKWKIICAERVKERRQREKDAIKQERYIKKRKKEIAIKRFELKEKLDKIAVKKVKIKKKTKKTDINKSKILKFNKTLVKDEEYFDDAMYRKEQEEYNKPNGKICKKCKKALWGNYYRLCPECFRAVSNNAPSIDIHNVFIKKR